MRRSLIVFGLAAIVGALVLGGVVLGSRIGEVASDGARLLDAKADEASEPGTAPPLMTRLTPTDTNPASGCRLQDGTRFACSTAGWSTEPGPPEELAGAAFDFCNPDRSGAGAEPPIRCDIEGQPRFQSAEATPEGCEQNKLMDAGADEFYAAGCEPLLPGVELVAAVEPVTVTVTETSPPSTVTETTPAPPPGTVTETRPAPPPETVTTPAVTVTVPAAPLPPLFDSYLSVISGSTLYVKWAAANQRERNAIHDYWANGPRAGQLPRVVTAFGRALLLVARAHDRER